MILKLTGLKKKLLLVLCLGIIVIQFALIGYFNKSHLTERYDASYWKDRYEHSQWQLPLSKRAIGDDGLYAYSGYAVINGLNPAEISTEVPPVGKYIIGASIKVFNNPIYLNVIIGILCLFLFYLLCKKILDSTLLALSLTTLLFLDPLFFSQLTNSVVDITQLFFLFGTFVTMISINRKNYLGALLCGVLLGLFAQTKFPVFFPIVFIIELLYLFGKKYINLIPIYLLGLVLGLLVPYTVFFLQGNTIYDLFKLEKYIVSFYLKSQLVVNHMSVWLAIFWGKISGINTNSLSSIKEWSIVWPIITFSSIVSILFFKKKSKVNYILISLWTIVVGGLIIFTIIPFYTRYLLLVLPFMYILTGYVYKQLIPMKNFNKLIVLFIFIGLIRSVVFLMPSSDSLLSDFYHNLSNGYFQDIYQLNIGNKNYIQINRKSFYEISKLAWRQAGIKKVSIREMSRRRNGNTEDVFIKMTYYTRDLGKFEETKSFRVIKEGGEWKILWNWNLLSNGFSQGSVFRSELQIGERGKIIDNKGNILVQDKLGLSISVIPSKIDRQKEEEMLVLISKYINVVPVHIQNTYLENSVASDPVELGTIYSDLSEEDIRELISFKGLKLTKSQARVYYGIEAWDIQNTLFGENGTRIYSSTNYHGIAGLEEKFEGVLSGRNGGKIILIDRNGKLKRIITEVSVKPGKDVRLSL